MAEALDFQIDTMKFRLAIDNTYYSSNNTGRRYVRSTAPFKKDQIDTAQTPGDNSLTGWWTRGQFSFHEGAGVKYYDIGASSDILNRFQESSRIDPWTPGRTALARGTYEALTIPASIQSFSFTGDTYSVAANNAYKDGASVLASAQAFAVARNYCANKNNIVDLDNANAIVWTNNNIGDPSGADLILRLFIAKGRIWALADNGDWFTLPMEGGTIPAGGAPYLFWSSGWGYIAGSPVGFAETPGPVYIARDRYVYSVTTATDGSVPTTSVPVIAADLGEGRTVRSIAYCRGYLGIITNTAFHVAAIGGDGSLTVGPEVITYAQSDCWQMFAYGDKMYFTATDDGPTEPTPMMDLYEVNIAEGISPLEPAWQKRIGGIFPFPTNGGRSFCVNSGNGFGDFAIASSGSTTAKVYSFFKYRGGCESSGWVKTGFHRLGTLDDKAFHDVQVSVQSSPTDPGQCVDVYRVDMDGTETYLGVVKNGRQSLPIGDVKAEAIALKFYLYQGIDYSGDYTPTLLGYQIRALPVPKRQRLIQVPLLLRDVIIQAGGTKIGRKGDAWKNLQALEALESSKAIVTYTDFRTGETGQAYIDGIEFTGDIETSHRTREFGGIAYVELRVIS